MTEELKQAINALASKAASENQSGLNAMQFSQAALNLANAAITLSNMKKPE